MQINVFNTVINKNKKHTIFLLFLKQNVPKGFAVRTFIDNTYWQIYSLSRSIELVSEICGLGKITRLPCFYVKKFLEMRHNFLQMIQKYSIPNLLRQKTAVSSFKITAISFQIPVGSDELVA